MNAGPIIWSIWAAFSAYWLFLAVYSIQELRTNTKWRPGALALYQRRFGVIPSAKTYVFFICISAVLVLSSGFWLPKLLINLLSVRDCENPPDGSPCSIIKWFEGGLFAHEPRALGQSLMPEGLEQAMSGNDLADLIAFLRQPPTVARKD